MNNKNNNKQLSTNIEILAQPREDGEKGGRRATTTLPHVFEHLIKPLICH